MKLFWETETRGRAYVDGELRAKGGLEITGHAAVFNQLSDDLGGWREEIAPGAFADTVKTSDIRGLWNHNTDFVLGRTKSGTLRVREDDTGLATDYKLPDTLLARHWMASIERGDVDQQSFAFSVLPNGTEWRRQDGQLIRRLTKVELFDVSPVTFPAYPQTDISAREHVQTELRNLAAAKRKELEAADLGDIQGQQIARAAERRELIKRLTPPPDPYSMSEILKRCRDSGS